MPYMVGEGGPELFIPDASGTVVPGGGGRGGAPNVVINNYAPAEVEASGDEDQLEITVRAIARDEFGSGRMNPIMRGKHGISPRLRAR